MSDIGYGAVMRYGDVIRAEFVTATCYGPSSLLGYVTGMCYGSMSWRSVTGVRYGDMLRTEFVTLM